MFILAEHRWYNTLIRLFFFNIDRIIFNFISTLYEFLTTIARTSPLSQADILDMAGRVYRLLAVFMVFKVTFSLIMYVVNPDDFSEKSKGVGKLGTNIVISLLLLILTPYIFNYAYTLQTIVLRDNSLGTLIFGNDKNSSNASAFNTAGDDMAFITMMPFFSPNVSITELNACTELFSNDKNVINKECETALQNSLETDKLDITETELNNYIEGIRHNNLGLMFRQPIALAVYDDGKTDQYVVDYSPIFSTAIGVVVVLLLISFCMDVALRSIKLAFLQLIAPIPIISFVDPKSGKDGMFKKWYQMCFKTYISLFVRLLAIYFAAYIISRVGNMVDIVDGSHVSNMILKIFIVIGALMFAKQLPKILEGLGIKLDGDGKFFLNPLKKFEEQALGGKRITGAAGALVSGIADRGARIATAPGVKGKLSALAGTPVGLLGAAARGAYSNGGYSAGKKAQNAVNRRLREGRINGLSATSSYLDYLGSRYGLDDATLEREGTILQRYEDEAIRLDERKEAEAFKYRTSIKNEESRQKTMKQAQEARKNVKTQGDRLMGVAKDVLAKKANFGTDYISAADKMSLGNFNFTEGEKAAMLREGFTVPTNMTEAGAIFDAMYAKGRKLNYKDNNASNKSNLETLQKYSESGFAEQDLTFYDKDGKYAKVIKAGQKISDDDITEATNIVNTYEKDATEAVFNDLNNDADYIPDAIKNAEQKSFENVRDEYIDTINKANEVSRDYNNEYASDPEFEAIDTSITTDVSAAGIKKIMQDMETGDSTTAINKNLRTSSSRIEAATRKITEIENDEQYYIDYVDENGQHYHESTSQYRERVKPRSEKHKRNLKRHQQRRSMFANKQ